MNPSQNKEITLKAPFFEHSILWKNELLGNLLQAFVKKITLIPTVLEINLNLGEPNEMLMAS